MTGIDVDGALALLRDGEISVEGRLVDASNATLFCDIALDGSQARCVYKPVAGERPLWDFPDGTLAAREVAAYAVSEATGWGIVPPTVMREGPFGPGMCQLWIDTDPTVELVDVVPPEDLPTGWRGVLEALGSLGQPVVLGHADDPRLRRMAVLDAVINNADRKGGHVLPMTSGQVLGVDHGVCFHVESKLRTVLWGWAGEALSAEETEVLRRLDTQLDGDLGERLGTLLTRAEVRATRRRVTGLLAGGCFTLPAEGWPSIPWPPF
ncbi:MAG: hypothetical protein QOH80_1465 [Actinomycetota bacterium]|nr:hypothetical protein [Actinomycetota bacterium]